MTLALTGAYAVVPLIKLLAFIILVGIVAATMFATPFLAGGPPPPAPAAPLARTYPLEITV